MADTQYTTNISFPDLQIKLADSNDIVLRKMALMLEVISGVTNPTTLTPNVYTPHVTVATTNGTVSSGSRQVTFTFLTGFTGTVLGQAYTASSAPLILIAPSNSTFGSIAYTVSAGSVQIVSVT